MIKTYRYTAAMDALSFLRAAKINQCDTEDADLAQAFHALKRYTDKVEQAEREAEDAKVVEFHTAIGANLNRIERHHRDLYQAARKFFEES